MVRRHPQAPSPGIVISLVPPYTADGHGAGELCRYGFDRVRVSSPAARGLGLPPNEWRSDGPGAWTADLCGSYLADNDRSYLLTDRPSRPSRTTPAWGRMFGRDTLSWAFDDMPPAVTRLEPIVLAEAGAVEFLWRGRATRIYQRFGDRWWGWCLDDWDNCLATGWLDEQAR